MQKITVQVEGMMCSGCENHVNDAVKKNFEIKSVASSHKEGTTTIITEKEIDEATLKQVIEGQGFDVKDIKKEPYEKKGLFGFLKK